MSNPQNAKPVQKFKMPIPDWIAKKIKIILKKENLLKNFSNKYMKNLNEKFTTIFKACY